MNNAAAYSFISMNELDSHPLEVDWLIEDYIPNNSVGMIFGASGTGKSHIALSIAAMIANGIPWFNKGTKQGTVLVMAGEGLAGISRRLKAIEKKNEIEIDRSKLFISDRGIGLDDGQGYKDVVAAIEQLDTAPSLIIIDTLARHLESGDENSNRDMTRFINTLEKIRIKYGCTIIIVHHTGKDGNQGARGASALRANIDFSFRVTAEKKLCTLTCDKMKDADDGIDAKNFQIVGIDLGVKNKKGKAVTGACVIHSDKAPNSKATETPTKKKVALQCFDSDGTVWKEAYVEACDPKLKDDSKKKQFREAREALVREGKVRRTADGSYELVDHE